MPKPFRLTATCATEHEEQARLVKWAWYKSATIPELKLLFSIPNGGERHPAVAAKMKAEGVKKGVPDLFLPVQRHDRAGLFIEMKRSRGGRLSPEQAEWHERLTDAGYAVHVCCGASEAIEAIERYLRHETFSYNAWSTRTNARNAGKNRQARVPIPAALRKHSDASVSP